MANSKLLDRYEAFLFDFDGVLCDTQHAHTRALYDAILSWGVKLDLDVSQELTALPSLGIMTTKQKIKYLFPMITEEGIEVISKLKTAYYEREFDEVVIKNTGFGMNYELIDPIFMLHSRYNTAVVSNQREAPLRDQLAKLCIANLFDEIIGSDSSGVFKPKPAPDCYAEAMRRLSVPPSRTVVFEDSTDGMIAAARSGAGLILRVENMRETIRVLRSLLI